MKIGDFRQITCNISEKVQDRHSVSIKVDSFSCSRDISGSVKCKCKVRHMTIIMLLSEMIYHLRLGLATVNLYTKFQVSIYTRYEDVKGGTK